MDCFVQIQLWLQLLPLSVNMFAPQRFVISVQCFFLFQKDLKSYAFNNLVNLFRSCLAGYYDFQALFPLDKKISLSPSCYPKPYITCLTAILSLSTFHGGTVVCKKARATSNFFAFWLPNSQIFLCFSDGLLKFLFRHRVLFQLISIQSFYVTFFRRMLFLTVFVEPLISGH